MEEELEYLNERIDELKIIKNLLQDKIFVESQLLSTKVAGVWRIEKLNKNILLLKNIRTQIKASKECLEQINATLERHGKMDANTDLHNKIKDIL